MSALTTLDVITKYMHWGWGVCEDDEGIAGIFDTQEAAESYVSEHYVAEEREEVSVHPVLSFYPAHLKGDGVATPITVEELAALGPCPGAQADAPAGHSLDRALAVSNFDMSDVKAAAETLPSDCHTMLHLAHIVPAVVFDADSPLGPLLADNGLANDFGRAVAAWLVVTGEGFTDARVAAAKYLLESVPESHLSDREREHVDALAGDADS